MFRLPTYSEPSFNTSSWLIFAVASMTLMLASCSDSGNNASRAAPPEPGSKTMAEQKLPQPPPPMTSPTQILSGGWILAGDGGEPQFDSIVVIRNGEIVGLGKRGSVEVPADSVGVDASGKWILPGSPEQLVSAFRARNHDTPTQFAGPENPAIQVGRKAHLVLLNSNPLTDPQALTDVHAVVIDGRVQVQADDAS